MAKFSGEIGYGEPAQTAPGVWEDVIVERKYYGDIIRNTRQLQEGDKVNDDISVQNSISIVADAYANEHFFAIRYVGWAGALWTVTDVEVQRPRLILRLGKVYNGPKAETEEPELTVILTGLTGYSVEGDSVASTSDDDFVIDDDSVVSYDDSSFAIV